MINNEGTILIHREKHNMLQKEQEERGGNQK